MQVTLELVLACLELEHCPKFLQSVADTTDDLGDWHSGVKVGVGL